MIFLHGVYHFGRKKVGARKDFCGVCERECLAEQWRSFDCHHLFFIPLVPLGSHERWECTLCGQDPRQGKRTRKGFKIAGLAALIVLLVAFLMEEAEPGQDDFLWGCRIVTALGILAVLYFVLKRPPAVSEDDRRKGVVPLSAETCVYCRGPLTSQPDLHCPSCQIRIYTEQRSAPPPDGRPILERFKESAGESIRPASESELAELRRLRVPEPVLAFYRQAAPVSIIENDQPIRLLPVSGIVEDNAEMFPGCHTSPHGFVVFASTFSGDAYAFDINRLDAAGEPRVVLISHEMISEETPAEDIPRLAKPVAANLGEFLEQFLSGTVDEECLDDYLEESAAPLDKLDHPKTDEPNSHLPP